MSSIALKNYTIVKYTKNKKYPIDDLVVVEEPLQIVLIYNGSEKETPITVTMRSPGNDHELAIGFLFSENIIQSVSDIEHIRYCLTTTENSKNKLKVTLKAHVKIELKNNRYFLSNSSCGICGKEMLDELTSCLTQIIFSKKIKVSSILQLPELARKKQLLFKHTGGIHACALFDSDGSLIAVKEDIGRHNALDKLIGHQLIKKNTFNNSIAVLSGRVSYEMAQKSAKAGIPIIVAIGAPTSLAINIAEQSGICLIGFTKETSFNVYSHSEYLDFEN